MSPPSTIISPPSTLPIDKADSGLIVVEQDAPGRIFRKNIYGQLSYKHKVLFHRSQL